MALTETITDWFDRNRAKREERNARTVLADGYRELSRLANQLKLHAETAPYPFVVERLKQMAAEKERSTARLFEEVERLGGRVAKFDSSIPSGTNHWDRMRQDVEDQKRVEAAMVDDVSCLALEAPEQGRLLRELVEVERQHKKALLDLLARADPQAEQT